MKTRILIAAGLCLGLAGCDTYWNPGNWFSNSDKGVVLAPEGGFPEMVDSRAVVSQVTELDLQRTPGGVLVTATGLPPRLGYWAGELVPENDEIPEGGVLTYTFRIAEPVEPTASSTPYARRVIVGRFVPTARLAGVSTIRVVSASNSLTRRR